MIIDHVNSNLSFTNFYLFLLKIFCSSTQTTEEPNKTTNNCGFLFLTMTFPWKKVKSTRLSRLVAGLHQPPKRGGSLVVETGFPTSLIDLVVKNRDRLRKSPKPKTKPTPHQNQTTHLPCNNQNNMIDVGELVSVQRERPGRFALFRAVFKVIIVAALAVGSRKLALWIMMAAFLLLLIEFFGSTVFGLLRPESESCLLNPCEVIQIADSELECEKLDETQIEVVEEMETKRSKKSGRIRRHFIKKLVPKKLRNGRKKSDDNVDDDDVDKMEEIEDDDVDKMEEIEDDDVDKMEEIEEEIEEEMSSRGNEVSVGSGGHCVSVIVIVVAGVVLGGRGVALLVTLLWCFMLRYSGRFRC